MSKANITDVAKLAGVSIKTVSRVVNHEPNVRESTQAKVEQAIAQLNYRRVISSECKKVPLAPAGKPTTNY
jgi:LacI family transcriptional regulator